MPAFNDRLVAGAEQQTDTARRSGDYSRCEAHREQCDGIGDSEGSLAGPSVKRSQGGAPHGFAPGRVEGGCVAHDVVGGHLVVAITVGASNAVRAAMIGRAVVQA